ncbi:8572_t:CDS:2 [Ambispora gerdemannii]|uniref:8572_t:CDS:1 n=1 Tax=Ambispora gerdemannii TaxID=144530 RepID=A0A9N9APJ1_9GLOM|nr:8572_t:CDS:2 [Ambispora gerdemannii]
MGSRNEIRSLTGRCEEDVVRSSIGRRGGGIARSPIADPSESKSGRDGEIIFLKEIMNPSYYTLRYLKEPETHCFPNIQLSNSLTKTEHDANFRKLMLHARYFHKKILWEEFLVLERLFYKNKNQHQKSFYFRRVAETRRILQRLKELDLGQLLTELVHLFYGQKSKKAKGQWEFIPSREKIFYALDRLAGGAILMNKALNAYFDTFCEFHILLSRMEFMTLSLAMLSLLARLYILTRAWLDEVKECFNLLRNWADCFPILSNAPKDLELYSGLNLPCALEIKDLLAMRDSQSNNRINNSSTAFEMMINELKSNNDNIYKDNNNNNNKKL